MDLTKRGLLGGMAAAITMNALEAASPVRAKQGSSLDDTNLSPGANAAVMRLLSQLPAVREGDGAIPIYIIGFAGCPYCQALHRQQLTPRPGYSFVHIVAPVSGEQPKTVIALWSNPTVENYQFYMARRLESYYRATMPEEVEFLNLTIRNYNALIRAVMPAGRSSLPTPTIFFPARGGLLMTNTYSQAVLDRLKRYSA